MDVLRLDKSSYLPDALIEGYESMIWTERYRSPGEFSMKTPNISLGREMIPEGSLISLRESKEVMIVETHAIDKNDDGAAELTISGRSFETFLEERDLSTIQASGEQGFVFFTAAEAAAYFAWYDVVSNPQNISTPDWVPNLVASDSTTIPGNSGPHVATTWGKKYDRVIELLEIDDLGIRSIRPFSSEANLITFGTDILPVKTVTDDVSSLRLDVYNGVDRTRHQSVNEPVILSYEAGDISDPQYLFTLKDFKNVVIAKTSNDGNRIYYGSGASEATTGLDRRVLVFDASNVDFVGTNMTFEEAIERASRTELAKHNQRVLFDGEVSPLAHYKYNTHYFLGDRITLSGEYDFEQTMVVSEYVRTEDQTGDRGYPTLVLAD